MGFSCALPPKRWTSSTMRGHARPRLKKPSLPQWWLSRGHMAREVSMEDGESMEEMRKIPNLYGMDPVFVATKSGGISKSPGLARSSAILAVSNGLLSTANEPQSVYCICIYKSRIHQKCCGSSSFFSHYHNHSCTNSSCQLPTCALKQTCQAVPPCPTPPSPWGAIHHALNSSKLQWPDLFLGGSWLDLHVVSTSKRCYQKHRKKHKKKNWHLFSHVYF